MPIETLTVDAQEQRPFATLTNGEINGSSSTRRERNHDRLAAFAQDRERSMPAFETQRFDVRPGGFRDPQPVEGKQAEQRMVLGASETGGDEHRADFVAIQPSGVGLVIESRSTNMRGGRLGDEVLLLGVPIEARDRAQATSDRRTSPPERLQTPTESLDVGTPRTEKRNASVCAPLHVLTEVELVGLPRQTAVAGQEADQRRFLLHGQDLVSTDQLTALGGRSGHSDLLEQAEASPDRPAGHHPGVLASDGRTSPHNRSRAGNMRAQPKFRRRFDGCVLAR